jgi:hypothetical protein
VKQVKVFPAMRLLQRDGNQRRSPSRWAGRGGFCPGKYIGDVVSLFIVLMLTGEAILLITLQFSKLDNTK